MYKNVYFDSWNNDIHLWDDIEGYSKFKYQPYAYQVDPKGDHIAMDGQTVKKVTDWPETAEKLGMIYEHDVPAVTRTLIDLYPDSDDISTGLVILPLDIEVAKEGSYSTTEEANNTITAISYYSYKENLYYCLLLDKNSPPSEYDDDVIIKLPDNETKTVKAKYFTFKSEFDLLKVFLREYNLVRPDIITGWNVEFFDMPYLYNRISKVLGKDWAKGLSPIKICKLKPAGDFNQLKLVIAGVSILDYLSLYKKFTYSESPNYKLDTIAKEELKRGKIEYDGDLDKLYNTDIKKFAEYNIVDVELIVALNEKLDLIDIARGICHKGHVAYEDFIFPSKYLDGASLIFCKRNNLVATSQKSQGSSDDSPAEGAFVKDPKPGLYKWVYDIDLTSLYPSNIISLNISPETKVGRVLGYDPLKFAARKDVVYNVELIKEKSLAVGFSEEGFKTNKLKFTDSIELRKYLTQNNLSISSNGILYSLDKVGLIPSILKKWFAERKEFNKLKKEYTESGDKNLAGLYDKKQLVTKILLNSFYGVLLLKTFRFHDKDNGEAVTLTGQTVINFSEKAADLKYAQILGAHNSLCIYVDTDSVDGLSKILINGNQYDTIENVFNNEKLNSYFIDVEGREFTFPKLELPYYEEKTAQILLGNVQYIERHNIKKKRFKLTLQSGKSIIVTEDHSIMVQCSSGELKKILTKDLSIGDIIISME